MKRPADRQRAIGRLTFANTLGGAVGALLAGFALLPMLGPGLSLFALAAAHCAARGNTARAARPARPAFAPAALSARRAGVVSLRPHGDSIWRRRRAPICEIDGSRGGQGYGRPDDHAAGPARGPPSASRSPGALLTDSYSMSGIDRYAQRYMQLFAWLPLSLHPAAAPRPADQLRRRQYGAGAADRPVARRSLPWSTCAGDPRHQRAAAWRGRSAAGPAAPGVVVEDGAPLPRAAGASFSTSLPRSRRRR